MFLFQVYKTFSDAVVLDWFISLHDKDRMTHCDVTYFKLNKENSHDDITDRNTNKHYDITDRNNSNVTDRNTNNHDDNLAIKDENADDKNDNVEAISAFPFLPASRTFVLRPLEANQTYSFQLTCQDSSGDGFATKFLTLNTSK